MEVRVIEANWAQEAQEAQLAMIDPGGCCFATAGDSSVLAGHSGLAVGLMVADQTSFRYLAK